MNYVTSWGGAWVELSPSVGEVLGSLEPVGLGTTMGEPCITRLMGVC